MPFHLSQVDVNSVAFCIIFPNCFKAFYSMCFVEADSIVFVMSGVHMGWWKNDSPES